jgi:hypothetical protein
MVTSMYNNMSDVMMQTVLSLIVYIVYIERTEPNTTLPK